MKPVIIEVDAERELLNSVSFYEQSSFGLGLEFEETMRSAVETIRAAPERSPKRPDGTRRYVVQRFPFVIHYIDLPGAIWIVAFAHTSREPGYWRERRAG